VFTSGSKKGFKVSSPLIPTGGQTPPIIIDGDKAPWKNAQKKGKNSIASETKKSSIPCLKSVCTARV